MDAAGGYWVQINNTLANAFQYPANGVMGISPDVWVDIDTYIDGKLFLSIGTTYWLSQKNSKQSDILLIKWSL